MTIFTAWMPIWNAPWRNTLRSYRSQICGKKQNLPAANTANIDVNKARFRIVADSAAVKREGHVSQMSGSDAWHADIDGFSLHMQAMRCDALRRAAQKIVAPWCTVTANDIDLGVGAPDSGRQIVKQIEHAPVQLNYVARAMIT